MHFTHTINTSSALPTTARRILSSRISKPLIIASASNSNRPNGQESSSLFSNLAQSISNLFSPPPVTNNIKTGASSSSPSSPPPSSMNTTTSQSLTPNDNGGPNETITLGGGCFWCLEACYQQLKGVIRVESGYAAGQVKNPTYDQVCGGRTGHAEVVKVVYDPSVISTEDILNVFFTLHDPTTKDRQGNDVGTQYRSIVLFHHEAQRSTVESVMAKVQAEQWWGSKLVTQVEPYDPSNYYTAEKYHQNYFALNPGQGYCRAVVGPKVTKIRSKFFKLLLA